MIADLGAVYYCHDKCTKGSVRVGGGVLVPKKCTVKNGDLYIIIFINVHKCTRGEGGLRKSSLCTVVIMIIMMDGMSIQRHCTQTTGWSLN